MSREIEKCRYLMRRRSELRSMPAVHIGDAPSPNRPGTAGHPVLSSGSSSVNEFPECRQRHHRRISSDTDSAPDERRSSAHVLNQSVVLSECAPTVPQHQTQAYPYTRQHDGRRRPGCDFRYQMQSPIKGVLIIEFAGTSPASR